METELAVVGGGPGGYVAAIRAAQLGVETTLIERDRLGGVCLSEGCIPSKALLSATGLARRAGDAGGMGVDADPTVDPARLTEWQSGVVDQLTDGVGKRCRSAGVEVVEGTARFVDDRTLSVDDGPEVGFEDAVVATGSRPVELPGLPFADEAVWSSGDALAVPAVPDRLVVVGAGYVGLELATVYARLGTAVTVLEALDRPLPGFEADLARYVRRSLADEGVAFEFGHAVEGYRETADGVAVAAAADGEDRAFPADRVLVAVGREPVADTVGVENAGVRPDDGGYLPVDEQCRVADGLFAVGDVAGEPMLAHKAMLEGRVAAGAVAGEPVSRDRVVPAAVYTDPEVAAVGLTEEGAAEAGHDPVVGEFRLGASGRALTEDRPLGLVRVVADAGSGRVVGGAVVGADASELVAELTLAVEQGVTLAELGGTVHAHPTVSEAVAEAAEQALGRAIHTR